MDLGHVAKPAPNWQVDVRLLGQALHHAMPRPSQEEHGRRMGSASVGSGSDYGFDGFGVLEFGGDQGQGSEPGSVGSVSVVSGGQQPCWPGQGWPGLGWSGPDLGPEEHADAAWGKTVARGPPELEPEPQAWEGCKAWWVPALFASEVVKGFWASSVVEVTTLGEWAKALWPHAKVPWGRCCSIRGRRLGLLLAAAVVC